MKKVLKIVGVVVLAVVMAVGGYAVGQRTQINSISSALPKNVLEILDSTAHDGENTDDAAHAQENVPPKDAVQVERNIIEKNTQTAAGTAPTVVSSTSVTLNGADAEVKLYTSAEKDTDGDFLWDDGNQWVLEVEKDGGYYTLINKYVQLGKVTTMVADDENGEGVIMAIVSTNSGLTVEKYTYNGTAFEGEVVYSSGMLNVRSTTF